MINTGLPNIASAVMAWARPTTVWLVGKRDWTFKTYDTYYKKTGNVFRQPTGQTLEMKFEGQRKWNEEKVFTDTKINLDVDDLIMFDTVENPRFRILEKTDYSQFGYYEYLVKSDYQ